MEKAVLVVEMNNQRASEYYNSHQLITLALEPIKLGNIIDFQILVPTLTKDEEIGDFEITFSKLNNKTQKVSSPKLVIDYPPKNGIFKKSLITKHEKLKFHFKRDEITYYYTDIRLSVKFGDSKIIQDEFYRSFSYLISIRQQKQSFPKLIVQFATTRNYPTCKRSKFVGYYFPLLHTLDILTGERTLCIYKELMKQKYCISPTLVDILEDISDIEDKKEHTNRLLSTLEKEYDFLSKDPIFCVCSLEIEKDPIRPNYEASNFPVDLVGALNFFYKIHFVEPQLYAQVVSERVINLSDIMFIFNLYLQMKDFNTKDDFIVVASRLLKKISL